MRVAHHWMAKVIQLERKLLEMPRALRQRVLRSTYAVNGFRLVDDPETCQSCGRERFLFSRRRDVKICWRCEREGVPK
jgi:hypothetical protein